MYYLKITVALETLTVVVGVYKHLFFFDGHVIDGGDWVGRWQESSMSFFTELAEMLFATAGAVRHPGSQSAPGRPNAAAAALPDELPK